MTSCSVAFLHPLVAWGVLRLCLAWIRLREARDCDVLVVIIVMKRTRTHPDFFLGYRVSCHVVQEFSERGKSS